LTPVPSLSRLAGLVDTIREAGLVVTCRVTGPVAELPPGVDLTAYRIVQEALTNALRHAPGAAAAVRVACAPGQVTVEVSNTAPPPRPPTLPEPAGPLAGGEASAGGASVAGPGYGLAGIAERVASCGGALALGPTADGGFAVTARLPLP
jgi:signal transduction histidine kinase